MPKRRIELYIIDILIAIDVIKRNTATIMSSDELIGSEVLFGLVCRESEIIGEAMSNVLDEPSLSSFVKYEWRKIVDFRNVVAHEYFGLNQDDIYLIVNVNVPLLEIEMVDFINKLPIKGLILNAIKDSIIEMEERARYQSVAYLESLEKRLTR